MNKSPFPTDAFNRAISRRAFLATTAAGALATTIMPVRAADSSVDKARRTAIDAYV